MTSVSSDPSQSRDGRKPSSTELSPAAMESLAHEQPWHEPVPTSSVVSPSAIAALLRLSADRQVRGRKLLALCLLFVLPLILVLITRHFAVNYRPKEVENVVIFTLFPQALLPLAALLFASGMIQDEIEEQTLTYLLIRPIPRWLIYTIKLIGTWLVLAVLSSIFVCATLAAVYWGAESPPPMELAQRGLILSGLLSLSLFAYTSIFGGASLLVKRPLLIGIAYILVLEGVAANIDFTARWMTVMFYLRTLCIRWLGLSGADWSIDLNTAPTTSTCLLTLLGIVVVPAILGAWVFSIREFRVKTPEGN